MILVASILVGVLAAYVAYRMLFYDLNDFGDGFIAFFTTFLRRRWPYRPTKPPAPEDFEDERWSSGLRFGLFLAVVVGAGVLTYNRLHKYFA